MSVPPTNTNPQAGFGQAPPPAQSGSGGCWKAAGIGCAVLFLLGLIGLFFAGRFVKDQMAHPTRGGIFGTAMATVQATQDGEKIQQAIVAYHTAHSKYPDSLMTLVSDGTLDGKLLHNDLDPNPNPGSVSWHYVKPGPTTPQNAPLLTEKFRINLPGAKPQSAEGTLIIDLDGKTASVAAPAAPPTKF